MTDVVAIAAANDVSLVLARDGTVWAWDPTGTASSATASAPIT
ncbi:MAG: hypothetical protein R2712_03245 [Vicinamibacterales bacterium]